MLYRGQPLLCLSTPSYGHRRPAGGGTSTQGVSTDTQRCRVAHRPCRKRICRPRMASSGAIGTQGPKTASRWVPGVTTADPNRPGSCGTSCAAQTRRPSPRPRGLFSTMVQVLGRELFVEGRTVFEWSGSRAYSGFWGRVGGCRERLDVCAMCATCATIDRLMYACAGAL